MLRLVLNIFFMSFHRLGITRVSFSLSLALCMLPFNIYNPYKSGLFFISFWAWMRMEGARQGGIGQGSTNGSYKRFQDAMLPLPSGVVSSCHSMDVYTSGHTSCNNFILQSSLIQKLF